jgi:hypothetical protein
MSRLTPTERQAVAALEALYARLPTVACRGECSVACGPIPLTVLEARRLQVTTHRKPRTIDLTVINAAGVTAPREQCVYLTDTGRCSAYAVRPLLCRAWGVLQALSCIRGCVPERWISPIEFVVIAQAVERLGGPVVRTSPVGLTRTPDDTFLDLRPQRETTAIDDDAERTRSLRALHGGRILAVVKHAK